MGVSLDRCLWCLSINSFYLFKDHLFPGSHCFMILSSLFIALSIFLHSLFFWACASVLGCCSDNAVYTTTSFIVFWIQNCIIRLHLSDSIWSGGIYSLKMLKNSGFKKKRRCLWGSDHVVPFEVDFVDSIEVLHLGDIFSHQSCLWWSHIEAIFFSS